MLARKIAGHPPGRYELIEWAVRCLLEDIDDSAVVLLAGADHEEYAIVRSLFTEATISLGLAPTLSETAGLKWAERELCRCITDGSLGERDGLEYLHSLWLEAGSCDAFERWMYLQDSVELIAYGDCHGIGPFTDMRPQDILPTIRAEALRVAEQSASMGPYR